MGLIVDNFAGGGGASTGIEQALGRAVDIAINHDEAAIGVHSANHPGTRHLRQSVYSVDIADETGGQPVAIIWYSPDCKHFSKAKGGKPREKNIRDLAWVVPHQIEQLQQAARRRGDPNWRQIVKMAFLENVEEFRKWGPLDKNGQPIKERAGEEFDLWVRRLRRLGARVEWRELRACDYGAPTSRKRLFMVIRFDGLPIVWPEPTHGRPGSPEVLAGKRLPWRTAAECIDWSIPCPSIFDRPRPLKDATCRRIAAGVMRYVVTAARPFIVPITHTGSVRVHSADEPLRTVTTAKRGELAAVVPHVMTMRNAAKPHTAADEPTHTITAGGAHQSVVASSLVKLRNNCVGQDAREPIDTISTGGHFGAVAATLVQTSYGEREGQAPRVPHLDKPLGTVVAGGGKHAAVAAFMAQHNAGNGAAPKAMTDPVSTITGRGTQQQLVETTLIEAGSLPDDMMDRAVKVAAFLVKYYGSEVGQHQAVDAPIDTIPSKARFAVVTVTIDAVTFVLVDIGMRMLEPPELAAAQGFPSGYVLDPVCWYMTEPSKKYPRGRRKYGRLPKSHQIAKIGNSVSPPPARALVAAQFQAAAATSGKAEAA